MATISTKTVSCTKLETSLLV